MRRLMLMLMLCGCAPAAAPLPVAVEPPAQQFAPDPGKYRDIVVAAAETIDATEEDEQGDVCSNCGGRGKVGDGRTMVTCPVCDGTGKPQGAVNQDIDQSLAAREPEPEPAQPEGTHKLTVTVGPKDFKCPACDAFKARDLPEIEKALPGIEVEFVEGSGRVPRFRIETKDGRTHDHVGRLGLKELQEYINR